MELIFLHGSAASGKLTTARALSARLGYPVFHNHLVVDLLTTVFPFGSEPFVRLREEFWLAVFADAARLGRSIVFTFAPEATVAPGFPERAKAAVEGAGGRIRFVQLAVSIDEQERRLVEESRKEFFKLTSVETLREIRARKDVVEQPPVDLRIDTEASDAESTAGTIIAHFGLVPESAHERY